MERTAAILRQTEVTLSIFRAQNYNPSASRRGHRRMSLV